MTFLKSPDSLTHPVLGFVYSCLSYYRITVIWNECVMITVIWK